MNEKGDCKQILRINTVLRSCFNDLKTISSQLEIYNPVIKSNQSTVYNTMYKPLGFC